MSSQASLSAAFDAAAAGNIVSNGLVSFIFGGDTFVYVEATGAGGTYLSTDFAVKLTGLPVTAGTALAGLGFDLV